MHPLIYLTKKALQVLGIRLECQEYFLPSVPSTRRLSLITSNPLAISNGFNRIYVIGGIDLMEDTHADVWCIDINSIIQLLTRQALPDGNFWNKLVTTGEAPGKISNHRAVAIGEKIYVYGGLINNDNQEQSLFSLDVTTSAWTKHASKVVFFHGRFLLCDIISHLL